MHAVRAAVLGLRWRKEAASGQGRAGQGRVAERSGVELATQRTASTSAAKTNFVPANVPVPSSRKQYGCDGLIFFGYPTLHADDTNGTHSCAAKIFGVESVDASRMFSAAQHGMMGGRPHSRARHFMRTARQA